MAAAIPFIVMGLSAISAIMGAKQAQAQGQAASDAANSQSQAAEYNASIARQNAQTALEQGNANEEAQRRKARVALGAQRAAIAEAGIGTSGSASDLVRQSAAAAELDALNIRYGAQLQSTGYLNNAALDDWQARQYRKNASAATSAARLNAGASVLSSFGSYAMQGAKIGAAGKTLGTQ